MAGFRGRGHPLGVSGQPIGRNASASEVIHHGTRNDASLRATTYIVLHRELQYLAEGVDGILTANGVSLEVTDMIVCRE